MLKKFSPLAVAVAGVMALGSAPAMAKNEIRYAKDSILVVYKDNATKEERTAAQRLVRGTLRDANADGIDDKFARLLDGRLAKLNLRQGADIEQAIKMISSHPAVKYAEPNYILRAIGMPDDPRFPELWGMHNTGQTGGVADADIDAPEAWDVTTGSTDVIIGVIDTGVDYNHPDLQANMWVNPGEIPGNGIDDDGNGVIDDIHGFSAANNNGDPMDGNGHGTHVAGTIGAKGNNGLGVAGVNWDVTIIGCQFLTPAGTGSTADAIACIDYMTDLKVNHGVDIKATNNSWGGGGFSQALKDSIEAAGEAGILFLAAAGNDTSDNDASPHYPSNYESDIVMSIASTDSSDGISWFSNWGATSVDMAAPGSAILSTVPGGGYESYSGTSMATPMVTGVAALVWSINPDLTPLEMKELLMNSGDANAAMTGKSVAGTRLNAANALDQANPSPSYRFSVTPAARTIEAGESTSYDFSVGSVAGWDGSVELSVSVEPALEGVSLSATSVGAGDSFTLNVASTAETQWGDYAITVSGNDGSIEKSSVVSLEIIPQGLNDFPYSNDTPVAIADNTTVTSTIEIADPLQIFGVNTNVNISHTWIGDLTVILTSPSGTEVVLHNREGSSNDDIVKSWDLGDFNGEIAQGTWTLSVTDHAGGDTGTLNNWGMVITALGEAGPSAPNAGFDYQAEGLSVSFSNSSSDINDDIAGYHWDFGDGSVSSEANPQHVYAEAGTYTVTLTATDATELSDSVSMEVQVFAHSISADISRALKSRRGSAMVDVNWNGALGDEVAIFRDGEQVATTANDGQFRDRFNTEANSVTYQVCELGAELCSDPVVAQF
ncbi:S8 family serine peptidase [Shewanella sp. YQ_9]|uniref:S8 family serine peptidase n=1 Tax=Shewanella sp. YQ_9 TaxID=3367231 RepID=UPI00370AB737